MSTTPTGSTSDLPDKTVTLSLNADGYAVPDQDPIKVNRGNQKIKWVAPFEFRVDIAGYDGEVKYKNGSGGDAAYEAKSTYFKGKRHKYSIIAHGKTNDPEIVIEP